MACNCSPSVAPTDEPDMDVQVGKTIQQDCKVNQTQQREDCMQMPTNKTDFDDHNRLKNFCVNDRENDYDPESHYDAVSDYDPDPGSDYNPESDYDPESDIDPAENKYDSKNDFDPEAEQSCSSAKEEGKKEKNAEAVANSSDQQYENRKEIHFAIATSTLDPSVMLAPATGSTPTQIRGPSHERRSSALQVDGKLISPIDVACAAESPNEECSPATDVVDPLSGPSLDGLSQRKDASQLSEGDLVEVTEMYHSWAEGPGWMKEHPHADRLLMIIELEAQSR